MTQRETEVLALIARHLTNAQIAQTLFISQRTVESHVSAMLRKLGLPDRRSLARHAEAMTGLQVKSGRRRLPVPVTPFIGRGAERAALIAAVSEQRLVTATGPGGIGKTRLALSVAGEVAATRRDGAWFVDLVHVTDPAAVAAVIAETLGVPEQQTTSMDHAAVAFLADSDALLVLDNCEHLLDGVRTCVDRIIQGCPQVTILATSRNRLLVPYERVFVVPGLSVAAEGGDAVDLFTARVFAVTGEAITPGTAPAAVSAAVPDLMSGKPPDTGQGKPPDTGQGKPPDAGQGKPPDTARVAALCQALEGIALAIELAAARFPVLGLDGLESGLDHRLRFLTAGPRGTDRHGSLRAAISWSDDLLSSADSALLRRIATFASWFDVEAACVVAGSDRERAEVAEGLARLAEHSLLIVERGEPTRYRALETIRQYGIERLHQTGELEQVRADHERYCRRAVAELERTGPSDVDEVWCARFDYAADDIGAALAWCAADRDRRTRAADLAAGFAGLLFLRGRPANAQRHFEQAAEFAATQAQRAEHLRLAAGAAASRFAGEQALRLHRMAADAAVAHGDKAGAARDLAMVAMYVNRAPGIMATLHTRAEADDLISAATAMSDGSPTLRAALAVARWDQLPTRDEARHAVRLSELAGDGILHSIALDMLIAADLIDNEVAEAVQVAGTRLEVLDRLPVGPHAGFELGDSRLMAAEVDLAAGDLVGATAHAAALARLPFYRDEDHVAISRLLLVDALAGRHDDVVRIAERFRAGWERAGRPVMPNLARTPYAVAMVHGMRGDEKRRAEWVRMTIDLGTDPQRLTGCDLGWAPVFDSLLALHRDDPAEAVRRLAVYPDSPELVKPSSIGPWRPWYAALWAEAAVLDHHPHALARVTRSRHVVRDNPIAAAMVERAHAIATGDRTALVHLTVTFARLGCPYQQARTGRMAAGH